MQNTFRIQAAMAIGRMGGNGTSAVGKKLAPRTGLKQAAKAARHLAKTKAEKQTASKATKDPGKKAAKKVVAHADSAKLLHGVENESKKAGKHAPELAHAFHHLQRAAAIISLLEHDTGGDLRMLLDQGVQLYRAAAVPKAKGNEVLSAQGVLRAAEHLGMAGLYAARADYRIQVPLPSRADVVKHLNKLRPRLDKLKTSDREMASRLEAMARVVLRRAEGSSHDPHMEHELTMAADGLCSALEKGL
jgi:hypothetical protein